MSAHEGENGAGPAGDPVTARPSNEPSGESDADGQPGEPNRMSDAGRVGRQTRTSDGCRGREYRWRSWFLRIFGWDCGYFLTPTAFGHKLYARWAFRPNEPSLGFLLGRDEDGEWGLDISLGPLLRIETNLPEYDANRGSRTE